MIDTQVQDDWFHGVFGVDPRSYGADAATAADAPPATGQAFQKQYDSAIGGLKAASGRVVPPGDATAAQGRLNQALDRIDKAVKAGDFAGAASALQDAQKEAKVVMAAPDPAMMPVQPKAHPDEVLYQTEPGDAHDVSDTDINQGGKMGDCFLLSSIGEIARIDPNLIKKMIKDNGNGTYTVTLHQEKSGLGYLIGKITGQEFEDVQVTVDGDFSAGTANSGAGQDEVAGKKEIWVQVLEKAYAKLHGGYDKIQGGHATDAMEALTGKKATYKPTKNVTLAELQKELSGGKPVVMDTPPEQKGTTLPFNLVGGHSYMLEGIVTDDKGKAFVKMRNPWGFKQPSLIPFDQLGTGIDWVDEGDAP